MSATEFLIDTNILIYHTVGSEIAVDFLSQLRNVDDFKMLEDLTLMNPFEGISQITDKNN